MYQTMLIGVFQLSRTNNLFSKKPITIILLLGTISYFTHYMTLCKPSLLHNKEELTSKCNHTLTNSWAICTASGSYGSYFPIRTLVLQRNEQVIFKEMAPAAEHLIQSRSQFQVPRAKANVIPSITTCNSSTLPCKHQIYMHFHFQHPQFGSNKLPYRWWPI